MILLIGCESDNQEQNIEFNYSIRRRYKRLSENALETVFYPTNKIRLPVNKENVIKSGLVKKKIVI